MASRSTKRRWRMSPQVRRVGGGGRGGDAPLPRPRDGALPAARRRAGLPPAGGRENLDASHARDMPEICPRYARDVGVPPAGRGGVRVGRGCGGVGGGAGRGADALLARLLQARGRDHATGPPRGGAVAVNSASSRLQLWTGTRASSRSSASSEARQSRLACRLVISPPHLPPHLPHISPISQGKVALRAGWSYLPHIFPPYLPPCRKVASRAG